MSRKIITACAAIFLVFACSFGVFAAEFDPAATGSISVTLIEQNRQQPIAGAVLRVYYVAAVAAEADGALLYAYTEDFEQMDAPLDDASLPAKLAAFVAEHPVPSVTVTTDETGTARCGSLPVGLYYVEQAGAVAGFAPCTPFLVTVPNETDGEYTYDVNASPKTDVTRLTDITIKKAWNTGGASKAPNSVTVQLLKNGVVVKTATLNAKNNWQVTYTDMPESDSYSILEINIPKGFTATYSRRGYVVTVTNSASLAQTGQLIWPIPVLAMAGFCLISIGTIVLRRTRAENA
jgi:hypothetical protein